MKECTIRKLITLGAVCYQADLIVSTGGNLSCRSWLYFEDHPSDFEDRIYITASGSHLGFLESQDFVPFDGTKYEQLGEQRSSMETPFHLEVYKKFPDIQVIAHVHAPRILRAFNKVTCYAPSDMHLELAGITPYNWETETLLHSIAVIPKQPIQMSRSCPIIYPSNLTQSNEVLLIEQLPDTLQHLVYGKRIIVYPYHGVVAFGSSPLEALNLLELLNSLV